MIQTNLMTAFQSGKSRPCKFSTIEEEADVHTLLSDDHLDAQSSTTISNSDITLSEYLKDNYTPTNSGTTVSQYLINNFPPTDDQGSVSMVPLRKSSYGSNHSDSNPEENFKEFDEDLLSEKTVDDEELKKARRRMKNKISAQESRRRKKEYVDALELKMKQRDQEKKLLTDKVTQLEEKVRLLVDELFQAKQNQIDAVTSSTNEIKQPKETTNIATQTGVCLTCHNNSSRNERGSSKHAVSHSEHEDFGELESNCHNFELDEQLYRFNEQRNDEHRYTQYVYDTCHPTENCLDYGRHQNSRRLYYDKPSISRTTSVSPRLMRGTRSPVHLSPPRVSSIRSNSLPARNCSSRFLSTNVIHPIRTSIDELSLRSQFTDTDRQRLSPQ